MEKMHKVRTDFNAQTPGGRLIILVYNNKEFGSQVADMNLAVGERIVVYQDIDDFEVEATLNFDHEDYVGRAIWTAAPDWTTLKRF